MNGYTPEQRRYLRRRFHEWFARHHDGPPRKGNRIADSPHFRRSLHELLHTHGYSATEVAEWLGLSRHRMAQLMAECGIPRTGNRTKWRYWNGERFVAHPKKTPPGARAAARNLRRAERQRRVYAARRERAIGEIRELADRLGGPPFLIEVLEVHGLAHNEAPVLAHRMGHDRSGKVSEFFDDVWRDAGYERPDARRHKSLRANRLDKLQ